MCNAPISIKKSKITSIKGDHMLSSPSVGYFQESFRNFSVIQEPYSAWNSILDWTGPTTDLHLITWIKYKGNRGQQCLLQELPISFQLHSCPSREEPWEANKVASQNFMVTLRPKARHNSTHCKKKLKKKRKTHTQRHSEPRGHKKQHLGREQGMWQTVKALTAKMNSLCWSKSQPTKGQ